MATLRLSSAERQALLAKLNTDIGINAVIDLYSGTMPANVDTAPAVGDAVLVTFAGNATAFGSVGGGSAGIEWTLTAGAIAASSGLAAAGSGTAATWARISTSGGTAVIDVDVGGTGSGATLILTNVSIASGQAVAINSLTITGANA